MWVSRERRIHVSAVDSCQDNLRRPKPPAVMSKNTSSTAFRRVNVDEFDEDNYVDDSTGGEHIDVSDRQKKCRELFRSGDTAAALEAAVSNPPLQADKSTKVRAKMWALHYWRISSKRSVCFGGVEGAMSELLTNSAGRGPPS